MRADERRIGILELLHKHGKVTVDVLADALDASKETIRRDLTELAAAGQLRKYHGGATHLDAQSEGDFSARLRESVREKHAIARAAAALYSPDDALFIDTGTTTLAFARELAITTERLTVVTNSVLIAQALLRANAGHRVFVLGGEFREASSQNVGPFVVNQLKNFKALDAVITVGAMDSTSVMDFDLEEAEIARAMIAQAKRVTVLADSSKLGRTALYSVCVLAEVDRLVTDSAPEDHLAASFSEAGIEIHTALAQRSAPIETGIQVGVEANDGAS